MSDNRPIIGVHCTKCIELGRSDFSDGDGLLVCGRIPKNALHGARDWCKQCREDYPAEYADRVAGQDGLTIAAVQTKRAEALVYAPASDYILWPWKAMVEMPPIKKSSIVMFAGHTGTGKTTWTSSLVADLITKTPLGVYVLPLEIRAHEWRVSLACHLAGVNSNDALSGRYAIDAEAGDIFAIRQRELIAMQIAKIEGNQQLFINSTEYIDVRLFQAACRDAAMRGMQVILVDHIDRIESEDSTNMIEETRKIMRAAKKYAEDLGLTMIMTTQMNSTNVNKQDRMRRFAPAQLEDILYHTYKKQEADQIYSLYRPLDPRADPEDIKRATRGASNPLDVLAKNRAGLVALKLRYDGTKEGRRMIFAWDRGKIRDRNDFELGHDRDVMGRDLFRS